MDDNVYYHVPKSDMDKNSVNTPLNVGGADPISIYLSVEAPKDTNHYRTSLINEKMHKSLDSEGSPESILKIYNFLNGLYRTSINLDKASSDEKIKIAKKAHKKRILTTQFLCNRCLLYPPNLLLGS